MKFVVPIEVDESNLTTNVENEAPDWAAGSYDKEDRVVYGEYVYEALQTTTDEPDKGAIADPPTWVRLGYSNVWRMWRDGVDSVSTRAGNIEVTVQTTSVVTTVAVLGAAGASARVQMDDPIEGIVYDETKTLSDIGVPDWWEWFFTGYDTIRTLVFDDLPAYGGTAITVTISAHGPTDEAQCGRVVIGQDFDAGCTRPGVSSRNMTFSKKERDAFGNLTLITRRTIRVVNYPALVASNLADLVQRKVAALSATPTLFIGDPGMPETILFGVPEDYSTIISGLSVTEYTLSVQEF